MLILPIKTRIVRPPKDDLYAILDTSLPRLKERDVVVITSKIVSIGEGRCIRGGTEAEKQKLIEREADYLARFKGSTRTVFSIKGHAVVGSGGIDESNGNGYWILWPKNLFKSAKDIWNYLRKKYRLKNLAVIITDSVSPPMRMGCIGTSIAFFGFHPIEDHVGTKDIFGRKFKYSRSNIVDGLAAAAVAVMGETREQIPMTVIRDVPRLRFTPRDTRRELLIPPKRDIYYPLLKHIYQKT